MKSEENSEHHFRKEKHTNLRRKDEKKGRNFLILCLRNIFFFDFILIFFSLLVFRMSRCYAPKDLLHSIYNVHIISI
jgi:hypothetical protein